MCIVWSHLSSTSVDKIYSIYMGLAYRLKYDLYILDNFLRPVHELVPPWVGFEILTKANMASELDFTVVITRLEVLAKTKLFWSFWIDFGWNRKWNGLQNPKLPLVYFIFKSFKYRSPSCIFR